MGFVKVSHWKATQMTYEMFQTTQVKCVPMIISEDANGVQTVRTGQLLMMMVTQFADEANGIDAQEKIADIRSKTAEQFAMIMENSHAGSLIAKA